jgi:hypothetical protein
MDNFDLKKFLVENKLTTVSKKLNKSPMGVEDLIKQWVNNNAGGYGPEKDDPKYSKFRKEMNILLNNTLEDFNPDNYGDSTSMSPDEMLEGFIEEAIGIISKYTMDYYGDGTSFSPDDIRSDFYDFVK